MFNEVSKEKPAIGRMVRIICGKHHGKIGVVKRHTISKFVKSFRYGNEATRAMIQARGRYGFCVLIQNDTESFWTNADYCMVCVE